MTDPHANTALMLREGVMAACAEHARAFPDGDFGAANRRLGQLRPAADALILASGRWPVGVRYIGNEEAVRLLGTIDPQAAPPSVTTVRSVWPATRAG